MIRFCLRWLRYRSFRRAVQRRQMVRKHFNLQRDLLDDERVQGVREALAAMNRILNAPCNRKTIDREIEELQDKTLNRLKGYVYPNLRDNVEVLLVVAVILMGIRTFFFQPMAIPTGSAQPTLYGIVAQDLRNRPDIKIPTGFEKWYRSWIKGERYYHVEAESSGVFHIVDPKPARLIPFVTRQRYRIGEENYAVWFPPSWPDDYAFWRRAGLLAGRNRQFLVEKGDVLVRMKVSSGDHLFVNRLIYNFRQPRRGETIVFRSTGLPGLTPNTHYIKRLAALGGERVSLGDDRRLRIDGAALDASEPGFEFIYGADTDRVPKRDHYSGHVNGEIGRLHGYGNLAPRFPDSDTEVMIKDNHYLMLGDNTLNSRDSRYWGDIPREKTIGRASFVFWPITDRFGWHVR